MVLLESGYLCVTVLRSGYLSSKPERVHMAEIIIYHAQWYKLYLPPYSVYETIFIIFIVSVYMVSMCVYDTG